MSISPSSLTRNDFLESLRVISCLIVILSHIYEFLTGDLYNPVNEAISFFAVSIFFFISGIVNTWSFQRHKSIKFFYLSRLYRIYPTYFKALLFGLILAFILGVYRPEYLLNFFFLQPLTGTISTNVPLWSLAFEVLLYLFVPFLFYRGFINPFTAFITLSLFTFFHPSFSVLWASFYAGSIIADFAPSFHIRLKFFPQYGKYTFEAYVYHYPILVVLFAPLFLNPDLYPIF